MAAALMLFLGLAATAQAADCPGFSKTFDLSSASGVNADFETQAGASGVSYDGNGLKMTLTESNANIVLQSYETYTLPLRLDMSLKASQVPGIITTMAAWGGDEAGDAIDLETPGNLTNLVLLSLFRAGQSDSGYNDDIEVDAASPLPNWDWMQMPDGYDSSDATYTFIWTKDAITWNVNGNFAAKYSPKNGAQWITSNVPIRLGLWANDPSADWAGTLDWNSNPKAEATFTSLTLSCPSDSDTSDSNAEQSSSQENESSSSTATASEQAQKQDTDSSSVAPTSSSSESKRRRVESSSSSEQEQYQSQSALAKVAAASSGMVSAQQATSNATEAVTVVSSTGAAAKAVRESSSASSADASAADNEQAVQDSSALAHPLSWAATAAFLLSTRILI